MREGDGVTGVDPQKIEVRKYGHTVPLAGGPCFNCGRLVRYNLAAGIAEHVDDGEPNNCDDPWPARKIEKPQIDSAALTGVVASATTQDAPKAASVAYVPRTGGTDATATRPPEPPPLSVALVRIPGGHPGGIVFRHYGPQSISPGWRVPNAAQAVTYAWAELHNVGEVTLLVEHTPEFERGIRADEMRGAARDLLDRHYERSRVTVATFADWLLMRVDMIEREADRG